MLPLLAETTKETLAKGDVFLQNQLLQLLQLLPHVIVKDKQEHNVEFLQQALQLHAEQKHLMLVTQDAVLQ
jgi:hypothetical protein